MKSAPAFATGGSLTHLTLYSVGALSNSPSLTMS